jgi:hypothetical protein
MAITDQQLKLVAGFREWIETSAAGDKRFGERSRDDRDDGSTLATRWQAAPDLWFELAVRPLLPQVRVGILTTDRWKSEELEQRIEDSGETMHEFVESGFTEAGLDWVEPPVEHYRDQGKYYYFATPLDLDSLDALADEPVRRKTALMLLGYAIAFGPSK